MVGPMTRVYTGAVRRSVKCHVHSRTPVELSVKSSRDETVSQVVIVTGLCRHGCDCRSDNH